ncbi:hypothetical protein Dimus_037822 [Dionaea muscipula]
MQGYHMALQYLRSRLPPDMTHDDLWGGMPKYADVGIDDASNVFFIESEVEKTVVGPSSVPESSTAAELTEVEDLIGASRANVVALASQEQTVKAALDAAGLEEEGRVRIPTVDESEDPVDDDPKDGN